MERTQFALIKPDSFASHIEILEKITNAGFQILRRKALVLSENDVDFLCGKTNQEGCFDKEKRTLGNKYAMALILCKKSQNSIEELKTLAGSDNPKEAEVGTIRKEFGIDLIRNSIYISACQLRIHKDINHFFSDFVQ